MGSRGFLGPVGYFICVGVFMFCARFACSSCGRVFTLLPGERFGLITGYELGGTGTTSRREYMQRALPCSSMQRAAQLPLGSEGMVLSGGTYGVALELRIDVFIFKR